MADSTSVQHEHSLTTGSDGIPPNHLGANVPSGQFDGLHDPEKADHYDSSKTSTPEKKETVDEDDDEDENMDALIDDLESQDGQAVDEEEEIEAGGARPVAEELLQTSTTQGLSQAEVIARRRKFGLNQMKEEKENLFLKFLGYFVGPIQFVMEVSLAYEARGLGFGFRSRFPPNDKRRLTCCWLGCRNSSRWPRRLGRFWCHHRPSDAQCDSWFCPRISSWLNRRRIKENTSAQSNCSPRWRFNRGRCT